MNKGTKIALTLGLAFSTCWTAMANQSHFMTSLDHSSAKARTVASDLAKTDLILSTMAPRVVSSYMDGSPEVYLQDFQQTAQATNQARDQLHQLRGELQLLAENAPHDPMAHQKAKQLLSTLEKARKRSRNNDLIGRGSDVGTYVAKAYNEVRFKPEWAYSQEERSLAQSISQDVSGLKNDLDASVALGRQLVSETHAVNSN